MCRLGASTRRRYQREPIDIIERVLHRHSRKFVLPELKETRPMVLEDGTALIDVTAAIDNAVRFTTSHAAPIISKAALSDAIGPTYSRVREVLYGR
jgi:hypothetical protein